MDSVGTHNLKRSALETFDGIQSAAALYAPLSSRWSGTHASRGARRTRVSGHPARETEVRFLAEALGGGSAVERASRRLAGFDIAQAGRNSRRSWVQFPPAALFMGACHEAGDATREGLGSHESLEAGHSQCACQFPHECEAEASVLPRQQQEVSSRAGVRGRLSQNRRQDYGRRPLPSSVATGMSGHASTFAGRTVAGPPTDLRWPGGVGTRSPLSASPSARRVWPPRRVLVLRPPTSHPDHADPISLSCGGSSETTARTTAKKQGLGQRQGHVARTE